MKTTQSRKSQYLLFLGAMAVMACLPLFVKNNYYVTMLVQTLINLIVVFGLNYITGLTGQMNLGTAGIYAFGAYTSGLLSVRFGISPWITILAAGFVGFLIGYGLGYPSLRMKGVYLSLTTIAFTEVTRLLLTNLPAITGGTQGVRDIPRFSLFGVTISSTADYFYFLIVIVIAVGLISLKIVNSKWGREFKAVRDNIDAVESLGLNVAKIKICAFTLAAIYGAVGGALYAHFMGYLNPITFTVDLSISYVIMLMVGGIGNVVGNIIGAAVVTTLPELLRFLGDYYQITYSMLILLGAIFLPGGLLSLFKKVGISLRGRQKGV